MYIHIISIHIYTYYIYICICMYNTFISYTLCAVQGRDDDVPWRTGSGRGMINSGMLPGGRPEEMDFLMGPFFV